MEVGCDTPSPSKAKRRAHILLEDIQEGKTNLRSTEEGLKEQASDTETFARGALLNELRKGKELKQAAKPQGAEQISQTMARAGLLHELQRKTKQLAPTAEGAGQVDPLTRVIKEGWLHKRATNGIWQKRYFVLTSVSLSYSLKQPGVGSQATQRRKLALSPIRTSTTTPTPPGGSPTHHESPESPRTMSSRSHVTEGSIDRRSTNVEDDWWEASGGKVNESKLSESSKNTMPIDEIRDVHPTGSGGEFMFYHNERQVRLRAEGSAEAAKWVEALVRQQLDAGRNIDQEPDAKRVLEGMVCPELILVALDPNGELVQCDTLGDTFVKVGELVCDPPQVLAALADARNVVDGLPGGDKPDVPLSVGLHEWGVPPCHTYNLLRWTHPKVLAPLMTCVFDNLSTKLLLDVDKSSWTTRLEFEPYLSGSRFEVAVRHLMWWEATVRRYAVTSSPTNVMKGAEDEVCRFRFKLQLTLHFLPNSVEEIISCDQHIIDYEFEPCSRIAKDEGKAALKPLCLPHLEYYQIWKRPLHRLPVHKDVPRLLKGMLAMTADGRELYRDDGSAKPAEPWKQVAALRSLMLGLARELDLPSIPTLIEEKFDSFLNESTADVAESLRSFLHESGLPEYSLCVQVFKCIHQEMIFPAVSCLRNSIYTVLPYKDIKGEWRVAVDVDIDSVKVTHRKWEQTQDADSAAFFKFRWGLQLVFDRRMRSLLQASVSVLDFEFGPSTSEERKRVVAAVLKPWLGPGVLYKRMEVIMWGACSSNSLNIQV